MSRRSILALGVAAAVGVALALGAGVVLTAPDTDVPWSVFGSGGGASSSTNFEMRSIAGQSAPIGESGSTSYALGAGFWYRSTQDADMDGALNASDNCPNDYNPTQTNSDFDLNAEPVTIFGAPVPADAFGNACDDDDDTDSPAAFPNDWTDDIELYLTNDPVAQTEACPRAFEVDDFWMPDNNHDRVINVLDLLPFKAQFKAVGPFTIADPARRQDFNMDDSVDVLDLLSFKHSFKAECTVP